MAGESSDFMAADEAVLITVIETKGSAPREVDTCMAVTANSQTGTIGGGRLEFEAVSQARKLLSDPVTKNLTQKYALGPLLEQCCGGSVVLDLSKMRVQAALGAITGNTPLTNLYMFGAGHNQLSVDVTYYERGAYRGTGILECLH